MLATVVKWGVFEFLEATDQENLALVNQAISNYYMANISYMDHLLYSRIVQMPYVAKTIEKEYMYEAISRFGDDETEIQATSNLWGIAIEDAPKGFVPPAKNPWLYQPPKTRLEIKYDALIAAAKKRDPAS